MPQILVKASFRFAAAGCAATFRLRNDPSRTSGDMAKVTIYTTSLCPYCHMAKELLRAKCVAFEEVDVTGKATLRAEMSSKAGGRHTVPQIWIGEHHVGGCDDLMSLERSGKLDPLLGADS